jgi:hypothetical protein
MMLMAGMGLLASAIPVPVAGAEPSIPAKPPVRPPRPPRRRPAPNPTYLFHDQFDGPGVPVW